MHIRGEISSADPELFGSMSYRDVAQLVARTAGGGEAAGSSPVIPTILDIHPYRVFLFVNCVHVVSGG